MRAALFFYILISERGDGREELGRAAGAVRDSGEDRAAGRRLLFQGPADGRADRLCENDGGGDGEKMNYQNPFMNPYGFAPQGMQGFQAPGQRQVEKVNGRNGAQQYPMGPNSSAWILDEGGLVSWLITTDSAGYKTVTAYDVAEHKEAPAPDYGSLEDRIRKLEVKMDGIAGNTAAAGAEQYGPGGAKREAVNEYGPGRAEPAGGAGANDYEQSADAAGYGYYPEIRRRSDAGVVERGGGQRN